MNKFNVEIRELLSRIVKIEAEDINEAYFKVQDMYRAEEIVLNSSDLKHIDFKIYSTINDEKEKDELIADVIDYLYNDEKKHYEECNKERGIDHIFLKLKRLKELI